MSSILSESTEPLFEVQAENGGLVIIGQSNQANTFFVDESGVNDPSVGGDDTIIGGNLGDTINGRLLNDNIIGLAGDDTLAGGEGNDIISGGAGADDISGGKGADLSIGGEGNDIIVDRGGDDTLLGGEGNDVLFGGSGADLIRGGTGTDLITGGDGNDQFEFFAEDLVEGTMDRITDFTQGEDGSVEDIILLKGVGEDADISYNKRNGRVSLNGEQIIQLDANLDITIDNTDGDEDWELF